MTELLTTTQLDALGELVREFRELSAFDQIKFFNEVKQTDAKKAEIGSGELIRDGWRIRHQPLSEHEPVPIEWAWEGRIPRRCLTVLYGTEGKGKTAVAVTLLADATMGQLPGCFDGEPVNVATFTPEDSIAMTIKNRMAEAGADESRIFPVTLEDGSGGIRGISLPSDTDVLLDYLVHYDVRLFYADPATATLDGDLNPWRGEDIRKAWQPLLMAMEERDITSFAPVHTNRQDSTNPRVRAGSSIGWRQIARAALWVGHDPDHPTEPAPGSTDPKHRCLAVDPKSNLGPAARTLCFELQNHTVEVCGREQSVIYAALGEECEHTVQDILAAENAADSGAKPPTKTDKAREFLHEFLADGPREPREVRKAAAELGIGKTTLDRAVELDDDIEKYGSGAGWKWKLRDDDMPEF